DLGFGLPRGKRCAGPIPKNNEVDMNRAKLRDEMAGSMVPFIGVYDVFSASLAAKYYQTLFVSGFGFAASHYGLPDIGFIAWPDVLNFVQRLRTVLPSHYLLV